MGAWRGPDGHDHWHRTATIVTAHVPRAQSECVAQVVEVLTG